MMPPARESQHWCTWAGDTGNKGEGRNLQLGGGGRKVEGEAELQPLYVHLVWFAVEHFITQMLPFFPLLPLKTTSRISARSPFENFGVKI